MDSPVSLFLQLPAEVRLLIYGHLLVKDTADPAVPTNFVCPADYYEYERGHEDELEDNGASRRILRFQNCNPQTYDSRHAGHRRQAYMIRADRFRARCMTVTYACVNLPDIDTKIFLVNRQVYSEAASVLYGSYTFDFDTQIEACVPFLSDLNPETRRCIKRLSIVKRALTSEKDFDRCEWKTMCQFVSDSTDVNHISLGIVAGKPKGVGWANVKPFLKEEIEPIMELDEMSWVREVLEITSLKKVDIHACIEHCPPPECSSSMAFFVAFSASIDGSFAAWLTESVREIKSRDSPISVVPPARPVLAA